MPFNAFDTGGIMSVWVVPSTETEDSFLIFECLSGAKTYLRIGLDPIYIEWSDILPEAAVQLWQAEETEPA